MRLTALCVCGTLLAFTSLSWPVADSGEGDLLDDKGFGPCAATLRPEGLCRQGQDENTCPYLFSLPPLTVHLPMQLKGLEEIMKDLQKLKDNVDQLRKMCTDCTVSQSERECERQRERENEKLNGETNWMNERNLERLNKFRQECKTDKDKVDINIEEMSEEDGDSDFENRAVLEENEGKKWEAEKENDREVIKDNEKEDPLNKVAEKDVKIETEWAKEKDKSRLAKVPTGGEKESQVNMPKEKVTDRDKNKDREGVLKGEREDKLESGKEKITTTNIKNREKTKESDHHVRQDETKETEKKTQNEEDRASDGIKMSEEYDENTDEEQEQHIEEKKGEMEKGVKPEQNNEKSKHIESIGHTEREKTIKEGVAQEEDREMGKEIKTKVENTVQTVQRDGEGELASVKATNSPDFVSISPALHSTSLAPRHDSIDPKEATTFTSSLPSTSSSDFTLNVVTDFDHWTDYELSTQHTQKANIAEHPSPDDKAGFMTPSSSGQQTTSATTRFTSIASRRPAARSQGRSPGSLTTSTTTPSLNLYTTTLPDITVHNYWTAKKNMSSNAKTGINPLPGRGQKPGENPKPGVKPEVAQNGKNPKNDHKHDRAPLPEKKTKHEQKQTPFQKKTPTSQKSKSGKETKHVAISKLEQRPLPGNITDQKLKNNPTPKLDQARKTDQTKLPNKKPNSMPPVQRATTQKSVTLNTFGSNKDPLSDRQPESGQIPIINKNSKPERKLHHPLKTDKPDQKQKPEKTIKSEKKRKPNQRPEPKQDFTPVQHLESVNLTPKPNQESETKSQENDNEHPSSEPKIKQDSQARQRLTPDQQPKHSQKNLKINQKPKPGYISKFNQSHPELGTDRKTKPNVKPKAGQAPQTNQGLKTPLPDQMPNLSPKFVPDLIPVAESNKTAKTRPPLRPSPPARPLRKPGATAVQSPKPAVQLKPSPKTKNDLDLPLIKVTIPNIIQNAQTDMPPTSGPVKQASDVTQSHGDNAFSHSMKKTVTPGPETYNSLKTGSFPHVHSVYEGFTTRPNRRMTSDLRPQTAGQPSSIPGTTRPNNRILSSVIQSTSPGPTEPSSASHSSLQTMELHNVKETPPSQLSDPDKIMIPVPSSRVQTTTVSPNFRSTIPANIGPRPLDAEFSTPSPHELRVKINQVNAQINNSLTPNTAPTDRRPKEHPEDNQGGSRPDRTNSKTPTRTSSKVTMTRRDCSDHLLRGETKSGVYLVTPDIRSNDVSVFCDMELHGGGWTVIQRRQDGSVSFNRTWAEYRSGFGELDGGEFWLGNDVIHLLTRYRDMVLRVELEDFGGVMEYAQYEQFRVASERLRYRLTVGGYSGTAGDALRFSKMYDHNNRAFTTPDRDHDRYPSGNCGAYYSSGWWFDACMSANLNGRYHGEKYKGIRDGIFWGTWHNISTEYYPSNDRRSFKTVRMMIRPKGFAP